jgi:hypothetical protein
MCFSCFFKQKNQDSSWIQSLRGAFRVHYYAFISPWYFVTSWLYSPSYCIHHMRLWIGSDIYAGEVLARRVRSVARATGIQFRLVFIYMYFSMFMFVARIDNNLLGDLDTWGCLWYHCSREVFHMDFMLCFVFPHILA